MIQLEDKFTYKGVQFEIIKRGKKAVMLSAKADFYDCDSIEVWQIRHSKDVTINGVLVPAREKKPSNEDYPYRAHQFMSKHYQSAYKMFAVALKRFNEYENGIRPKQVTPTNSLQIDK